jgi:basic membrane protein A
MKKLFAFLLALVLVSTFAGCGKSYDYEAIPDTMESEDGQYQVAFVTDIGQLKDKSFNQGTWEGVKRFASENNKSYKYYQPANGQEANDTDRYNAMKAAADAGAEIIVCAGFMQAGALDYRYC